jgi:hypothetical protein
MSAPQNANISRKPIGLSLDLGRPISMVPGTRPQVPVVFYPNYSGYDLGPYPIPPGTVWQSNPDAPPDDHVPVFDYENCVPYELYNAYLQTDGSHYAMAGRIVEVVEVPASA